MSNKSSNQIYSIHRGNIGQHIFLKMAIEVIQMAKLFMISQFIAQIHVSVAEVKIPKL